MGPQDLQIISRLVKFVRLLRVSEANRKLYMKKEDLLQVYCAPECEVMNFTTVGLLCSSPDTGRVPDAPYNDLGEY